jgi:hypothetical protein
MDTGEVQWLLNELKQVNEDINAVRIYYGFVDRGNTVSTRYEVIDEETEITWKMREYLQKQIKMLNDAREDILFEIDHFDESYLDEK